jgi:alpha-D-ribose 1-methylphosphonate 5-phosphate C-P lyase
MVETATPALDALVADTAPRRPYNYAFLDEVTKRAIRRAILKAVAVPGYQVPFGSREMPLARGWGTGGLQVTLAIVGPGDTVKVIDQGADAGVNASNIRRLIERTTGLDTTTETAAATIIQTRHRVPEQPLTEDQILVYQVPLPEPLRMVEPSEAKTRRMHAEEDYSKIWVHLYEDVVRKGDISIATGYPVVVNERHIMSTTPIPRWDVPKMGQAPFLQLFGAGREKRIYAIPPYTDVRPLDFEDYPFRVEEFGDQACLRCGTRNVFFDRVLDQRPDGSVVRGVACSDTAWCDKHVALKETGA